MVFYGAVVVVPPLFLPLLVAAPILTVSVPVAVPANVGTATPPSSSAARAETVRFTLVLRSRYGQGLALAAIGRRDAVLADHDA